MGLGGLIHLDIMLTSSERAGLLPKRDIASDPDESSFEPIAPFFDVGADAAKVLMDDGSFKVADSYRCGENGFVEAVWVDHQKVCGQVGGWQIACCTELEIPNS